MINLIFNMINSYKNLNYLEMVKLIKINLVDI